MRAPQQDDERTVPEEAEDTPDKEDIPHEDEEQVHGEAEGHPEKTAEHDPVGEANIRSSASPW